VVGRLRPGREEVVQRPVETAEESAVQPSS